MRSRRRIWLVLLLVVAGHPAFAQDSAQPTAGSLAESAAPAWSADQLASLGSLNRPGHHVLVTLADPQAGRPDFRGRPGPTYMRGTPYSVSPTVRRAARRLAGEFDLEPLIDWPIPALQLYCLVFLVPESADLEAVLDDLRAHDQVRSAEPLHVYETQSAPAVRYDDPYAHLQHALDTLRIPSAHAWSTGRGVDIAIIDTGADASHPDLRNRVVTQKNFVTPGSRHVTAEHHGTTVAGVIAADANNGIGIVGIAPDSRLHILRACWQTRPEDAALCNSFTLAQALSHALDSGVSVINLSLGGPPDTLLSWLVEAALAQGTVVVAAAPPPGRPAGFPSAVPGVLVVAAAESAAGYGDAPPHWLHAPGEDILATAPGNAYDYRSGSSLSAAIVSGITALLRSGRPEITASDIGPALTGSRVAPGEPVNACRALTLLSSHMPCDVDVRMPPSDFRPTVAPRRRRRSHRHRNADCRSGAGPSSPATR